MHRDAADRGATGGRDATRPLNLVLLLDNSGSMERADRVRISPLVGFETSKSSRLRLQYNYDESDHLGEAGEHSVWLTFQTLIGVHQPHRM